MNHTVKSSGASTNRQGAAQDYNTLQNEDPLIDKIKEVLSHQTTKEQQFVQFYPNQTQYIINLHNHIEGRASDSIQPLEGRQRRAANQTNPGRRKTRKEGVQNNQDISNEAIVNQRKQSLNSQNARVRVNRPADIPPVPKSVSRRRTNWFGSGQVQKPKVNQDLRSSQYDKLRTQFTIYQSQNNRQNSQTQSGDGTAVITSRVKTQRQELLNQSSDPNYAHQLNGSMRFSQVSPKIRINNQTNQPNNGTPQLNVGSPRSSIGQRRKGSRDPSRKRDASISGNRTYQNEKIPLNELLRQKGSDVLTGSMNLGGPKLFINKQQSTNEYYDTKQEIEFQSIEAMHHQYLEQYPTYDTGAISKNNQIIQSFDMMPINKEDQIQSTKSSHLEMYKSIPLKNFKKAKGNGVIKYSTHHKQLSNNQPTQPQLQPFSGLPGTHTELGPLQFGGLGEPIAGARVRGFAAETQEMQASSEAQNISIINEINQKFKTSRISPGQQIIGARTRQPQNHQLQSIQPGSESSYFKGPSNHFRQNKKQSMQPNVTGRMMPLNAKLVSNHASVSQSQVPRMTGNFTINQQPSAVNSLKTRYGRSKKSTLNNDSASRQVIRSYSRSINNLNQKLGNQGNAKQIVYGHSSVGTSIRQAMNTIQHDDQRARWQDGKGNQNRNLAGSSLSKEKILAAAHEEASALASNNIQINRAYKKSQKIRVSGSINYQPKPSGSLNKSNNTSLSRSKLQMKTQASQVYPQSTAQVSSLYQSHNNQHSNMKKFNTINQASQNNQKRFRTKNQTNPTWTQDWGLNRKNDIETNSTKKKNLSPICILDNSQEAPMSSANRNINKTQQQNSIDPEMLAKTQKQYSQMFKKTENLTEQIRKVNKIQIKKRFKESLVPEKTLVKEAHELIKQNFLSEALEKLLEFIKLQPLNVDVHFEIGGLYRQLAKQQQKNEFLEEAILHFEQVIKHNEHNRQAFEVASDNDDIKQQQMKTKQELSAEALFEIVKIHIHHRDFYQASYELDRAKHFKYDQNAKKQIGIYLQGYHKFVQAVILMMKRKIEPANKLLTEIIESQKDADFFKFMILMYRAYGSIILKSYTEAMSDINQANQIKESHLQNEECSNFAQICKFNLQLAQMLRSDKDKLPKIVELNRNFPKNKDVIRYHAAFLIQRQIEEEMSRHQESQKNAEKDEIIHDLRVVKRVGNSPLKKSQSEAMIQTHSPQDDSELDESEKQKLNLFYQKVATCNVDHPQKHSIIQEALKIIEQGLSFAPRDRHLLLSRSHLQFYQHKFFEALVDIEAVIEIERSSSGEEEPNATDLLHKGRCHACLSMFKEAIADFSKVIELDDELYDAYFFRGKCAYLIGETSQAFLDFQKLILIQPKNPMVHAFAGNLLMTTGSYDDATKAFTNADKVHPCAFAIYQRARCYLALGDIKNSMNDLYQACSMYSKINTNTFKSGDSIATHPNPIALRDKNCLETILNSLDFLNTNSTSISKQNIKGKQKRNSKNSRSNDEILCQPSDEGDATVIKSHESASSEGDQSNELLVLRKDLNSVPDSAKHFEFFIEKFTDLIEIDKIELREILDEQQVLGSQRSTYLSHDHLEFKNVTQDSRMQQQIIPNVNRIKIEKVRALLWQQNKQELLEDIRHKGKRATLDPNMYDLGDNDTDAELKQQGLKICPWSYYMENLFSKDDIYLYRGVIHFYQGQYKKAIQDFQYSNQVKKLHKLLDNQQTQNSESEASSEEADMEDQGKLDEGESDIQREKLRQYLKDKDDPNESTNTDLSDIGLCSINRNERIFNILLCYMQLNNIPRAKMYLKKLVERCPSKYTKDVLMIEDILHRWSRAGTEDAKETEIAKSKTQKAEPICIEPFAAAHRLCRFFPCVEFKLRDAGRATPSFMARPSFSFPFVKPPNMIPNVDETLLHTEFGGSRATSYLPQPQALWIKVQSQQDNVATFGSEPVGKQAPVRAQTQTQEHFQFTDNIVQPNESFCSQSQSYMSSCLSESHKRPETD